MLHVIADVICDYADIMNLLNAVCDCRGNLLICTATLFYLTFYLLLIILMAVHVANKILYE